MSKLIRIDIDIEDQLQEELAGFLFTRVSHGWEEEPDPRPGRAVFKVHLEPTPQAVAVIEDISARWPEAVVNRVEVEEENWAAAWRDFFTPVVARDTFEILPPWLEQFQDPDKTAIIIDPNMAFGTGHHPTTAMCLEELAELLQAGRITAGMRFLDLGTGTGILGMACAKKGLTGLGVEIDPLAATIAQENNRINKTEAGLVIVTGSIDAVGAVAGDERFDLILANILAEPLMVLAPDIVSRLAPTGALVLSGILAIQADKVAATYTDLGLPAPMRRDSGEWSLLSWR